jgi:hypothetical protein
MNKNWNRWIFASVNKYFNDNKGDVAIIHLQGTARNFDDNGERAELRQSGVEYTFITKGEFRADFAVSILISVPLGQGDSHRIQRLTGHFAEKASMKIEIKKYGNTTDDDNSLLGCLRLNGKIDINDYGQVASDLRITQSTVEASYELELKE